MTISVAALQLAFTDDIDADIAATAAAVRAAASAGAQVILPPELFRVTISAATSSIAISRALFLPMSTPR